MFNWIFDKKPEDIVLPKRIWWDSEELCRPKYNSYEEAIKNIHTHVHIQMESIPIGSHLSEESDLFDLLLRTFQNYEDWYRQTEISTTYYYPNKHKMLSNFQSNYIE